MVLLLNKSLLWANAALRDATRRLRLNDTDLNAGAVNPGADFPLHKYAVVPDVRKKEAKKEGEEVGTQRQSVVMNTCVYIYIYNATQIYYL